MAFSPRKQHINQHLANRQTKRQNKPALHRCNGQGDGECGREEWGSRTGASSWAKAEDRGRRTALWKRNKNKNKNKPQKNRHCLEFHQEKLKLAVSSRIRFSRFIFFSFILRF